MRGRCPPPRVAAPPSEPFSRASRVQFTNLVAYQLLLSLVNLLNLPLPQGTFVPRRSMRLTVLERDVERLRMLKRELDFENPDAVRGFLVGAKALVFELDFLFHQDRDLPRNEAFFADFERLSTLISQGDTLADAEETRDLAYKLSVMLPYYEEEAFMRERNVQAERWFAKRG
jgi:predicted RNase H-like HicB family nuclease